MDGELANIVYVYTVDGLYIKGTNWKKKITLTFITFSGIKKCLGVLSVSEFFTTFTN